MEKALKDAEQYVGDVYYWEKVLYEGRVFEDLEEFARKKKLNYDALVNLLDRKYTLASAVKTLEDRKNILKYKGKVFSTRKELAKHVGVKVSSLNEAFKSKDRVHTAVSLALKLDKNKKARKELFEYRGKEFSSLQDVVAYFNSLGSDLRDEDEVDYIVTLLKTKHLGEGLLIVDNKVYFSMENLSKEYGLDVSVLQYRLDAGWTLDSAVKYPCRLENVVLDGVRYSKLSKIALKHNIGAEAFKRVYSVSTSIKSAVEQLYTNFSSNDTVRSRKVTVNGIKYKNYRELESSLGVRSGAIEGIVTENLPVHLVVNCLTATGDSKNPESVYYLSDDALESLTLGSVSNYDNFSKDGVDYTTLPDFCKGFDLDKRIVACFLKRGYHPDEVIRVCNEVVGGHVSENE